MKSKTRGLAVVVNDTASVTDSIRFQFEDARAFWSMAVHNSAGFVVTVFPTRDGRVRARVHADGHSLYTADQESYGELFARLSELAI